MANALIGRFGPATNLRPAGAHQVRTAPSQSSRTLVEEYYADLAADEADQDGEGQTCNCMGLE